MTRPAPRDYTAPEPTAHMIARKAAPAVATSTVLILARLWNANGAEHSTGAAVLMGALALGTAAAGVVVTQGRNGDSTSSALTFTAAGTLAFAGVAAYTDDLPLPLLLWAVATILAYILGFRAWREDRRADEAHGRSMDRLREEHRHRETVVSIETRASLDTKYVELQVVQEHTKQASALADAIAARSALPGFDPAALLRTRPHFALTTETEATK